MKIPAEGISLGNAGIPNNILIAGRNKE